VATEFDDARSSNIVDNIVIIDASHICEVACKMESRSPAALARAFRKAGAATIVIGDIDADAAESVAAEVAGRAHHVDVADPDALARFLAFAEGEQGSIDILCSDAGILPLDPEFDAPQSTPDHIWQRAWEVNVMAHVRAARLVLPSIVARR
jgi:NAD(P)-dependent dehydrogenase (short-subunit alcohol dehydrogenase family)